MFITKSIVREKYLIPIIDEILEDTTGALMFSKLYIKYQYDQYHQLELGLGSRHHICHTQAVAIKETETLFIPAGQLRGQGVATKISGKKRGINE